jgi:methylated-DNA-protein-cysteine methyltransferase-like protein
MSTDPSDYVEAVLSLVERIPPGRVMSYGAIAEYLYEEFGRASPRRVGTIMAQYGGSVPWYRVVTGGGRLPLGHEERAKRLLQKEGVIFKGPRVVMATYAWWPDVPRELAERPSAKAREQAERRSAQPN